MKERLRMKKWYPVIIVLGIILLIMSCGGSKKKAPIPTAAISEIYALNETKAANGVVEVKEVQDRAEFCYIMIYIKSLPGEVTPLNEALDKAKIFTGTLVKSAVDILKGYDINQDVSVWAQLPLKEGEVEVLGHARYDAKNGTFHDFVRLES
jgi:hypothetical protein